MDLDWLCVDGSRSRRDRGSRVPRPGFVQVERLEGRALLAITVGPISAAAGHTFTGLVATMAQSDVSGTIDELTANITWGDGQSSAGTISLVGTNYQVQGSHLYTAAGSRTLQVTVTGTSNSQVSGQGTATVSATPISLSGLTITPTLGQSFDGNVALFQDTFEGLTLDSYSAVITWGDGQFSTGVIASTGTGSYSVSGTHTYATEPAAGAPKVQVQRLIDGQSATATFQVTANPATGVLQSITVNPITAASGVPFTGQVATLEQSGLTSDLSNVTATINWGDGQSSSGTVSFVNQDLQVRGGHTYAAQGTYNVIVTVAATGVSPSEISGQAAATVSQTAVTLVPGTITPVLAQPFTGSVATFFDTYTGQTASSYSAVIDWGDGQSSAGEIQASGSGYSVGGSHTYTNSPTGTPKVTVVRLIDGASISGDLTVQSNPATTAFSGALDPASDSGPSNTDSITSINQPTFRGTATPYSIVQLVARSQGQSDLDALGQTVADPSGNWTLTVNPMRDGVYSIFANVAPPNAFPIQLAPLSSGSTLVIDTAGPRVVSVVPGQKNHRILVSFQDALSGLDQSTLTNAANYTLIGSHPRRKMPVSVALLSSSAVLTSDPQMVQINARSTFPVTGLRVVAGGVKDIAGNPLNGLYTGTLPSGGHPQGASFIYRFGKALTPARTVTRAAALQGEPLATGRVFRYRRLSRS